MRFRALVQDQLHNYQSHIVREIIESVRRSSPKGGFVKKVNGKWFDVGERARREKTGQQIRDLLHTQYRSSTKAKARTRKRLRKSHSENSATRVNTQAAVASVMASRSGSLPARIVTLDSETSPNSAAAAARSAMARQGHFRRNSESDLDRDTDREPSFDLIRDVSEPAANSYDGLRRLRDTEVSFNNPMNRMMHMSTANNLNTTMMGQSSTMMSQSSMACMGMGMSINPAMGMSGMGMGMAMNMPSHAWGAMTGGVNNDAFTSQPHFASMIHHQTQHNPYGGASQPSFVPSFGTMSGSQYETPAAQSHSMNFRTQTNMAFQSAAAFNSHNPSTAAAVMMQGQPHPMQSYVSSNTRPNDPFFHSNEMVPRTPRMARPIQINEEANPLLLPIESNTMYKEDPSCSRHQRSHRTRHDDDEESEKSFEEAIDSIYAVDTTAKRL
jgi:hypothetical protein